MAVALLDLISRLGRDVRPYNSVPSAQQVREAIQDAADALAEAAPIVKTAPIAVVRGTAAYALPADFARVVRLAGLARQGRAIIDGTGIIPMDAAITTSERLTTAGGLLTISPTPGYTISRELTYAAGHVLTTVDGQEVYADLTPQAASVLLLKAQSLVLLLQATDQARRAWSYQVGDQRTSKEKLSAALREQADALRTEFERRAAGLVGAGAGGKATPYGSRARYEPWG
jgi:hypothetical protein